MFLNKKIKSTYFSFPASLEANLVYQTATLKAMETISKIASCWALGGEQTEMDGYTMVRCQYENISIVWLLVLQTTAMLSDF